MRQYRNALFFLLGLILGGAATYASAEPTTDTQVDATPVPNGQTQSQCATLSGGAGWPWQDESSDNPSAICAAHGLGYYGTGTCRNSGFTLNCSLTLRKVTGYTCPSGQNWTLIGTKCTRSACVPPQTRQPDGTCQAPKCTAAANEKLGAGRFEIPNPQPPGVTWCVNNCSAYPGGSQNKSGNILYTEMFVNGAGGDASTCTGSSVAPNNIPNPTVQNETPCDVRTQGAITVDGKVKCVANTTPGATAPPLVNKSTKTETKSDGSKIITETTNTCTGDGACSTTITTTTAPNSAGQPGQAGAPGVSNSVSDKPSAEQSEFCAKNPNLQFCKGGMNEEKTQLKVLDEIQKFTNPDVSSVSGLETASVFDDQNQALKDQDDKLKNHASGSAADASVVSQRGVWETAMSNGWFEPVTISTCSPYEATIGGRVWKLDPCPTAQKISEIGAYCMWFMLAIGAFAFLTGGKAS